jgi:hypothetical protein
MRAALLQRNLRIVSEASRVWVVRPYIVKVDRCGSLTCPLEHHLASETLKVGKDSGVGDPASYELFTDVVDL